MNIFFTEYLYKENVFLIGLILNCVCTAFSLVLLILSGIQYKYININFTKLNDFQDLNDLELSSSIINVIFCFLGFFIFIKKLECKTLQKIYIITGFLFSIYSIIVCIISFISYPKIIKENSTNPCQSSNMKGILTNILKIESLFYEVDNYLNLSGCRQEDKNCENKELLEESISKISDSRIASNFDSDKFINYWSNIEDKFDCTGLCNTSYSINQVDIKNIDKYLFSENNDEIKYFGCIYPLSKYFYKMIISFSSLLLIYIIISIFCIYICFGIFLDKVYEGSNFPHRSKDFYKRGYIGNNIQKEVKVVQGYKNQESLNTKINNKEKT